MPAPSGPGRCRRSFGAAFAAGGNNFDQLRLLAALLVLFSHAYVLSGHAAAEPIARLSGHRADGGALAVSAFFAISGFLVTRSAERRPPCAYARARALRIWPALVAAVLVQTFVIGLACTALPWHAYLAHPRSWRALVTASIVVLHPALPGVFSGNPVPGAVNGSLWTLRVELACYAVPPGLMLAGAARQRAMLAAAAAALAVFGLALGAAAYPGLPAWAGDPRLVAASASVSDFCLGACCYLFRDRVPLGPLACCAAALAIAAARVLPLGALPLHLAWPYLVLAAGLAPPVAAGAMRRLGDLSYGVYLYAFPVQQAVIAALGPAAGPLPLAAAALPAVLALALLSSRLVEAPALRLKVAAAEARCG